MKLRYYIRGFGFGMVFTAIIVTVANAFATSNEALTVTETTTASTGSVLAYMTTAADTETTQNTQDETEQTTTSSADTQLTDSSTTQETMQETDGDVVTVIIQNIQYSSQATELLYDYGMIDDEDAFNSYLQVSGYASKVKEGSYQIEKGISYEQIAKIICGIAE